ncbi:MAG TPA: IPT/TIG domain-containing protein, partial [Syntrophobacteria bacterium]|nr:IPT/TIG domain-containing protein [Syntrophobacteria bacterium]
MAKPIQRINYHTGLFLEEAEFQLEQNYHLSMRQRINYAVFKPGVLYGMALDYTAGVLKVTAGMAIDETSDADFGPIGRELVLFQDSDPVSLSGFSSGNTAWITIEYDSSLDAPKAPTNIAARYTQKVKINALHADPGPGTDKILLGQIVIGTNSVTDAVQKASLRMTGAPLPVPTVTNFNPLSGGPGTSVTVTGTNFTGATGVSFGGVAATTFTVNSATQVTATVPAGAVTGKIRVTTPAGFGESVANFTLIAAPTVTNFNPLSGAVGASVVIAGTNFTGATGVSFGGVAATTFTVNSATQITATVPTGAVTGKIRVTTPAGFGESATNFTVAVPNVTGFTPPSGGVGVLVTIAGTNFTGATGVSFGGVAATTFTVNSATQITA